MRLHMSRILSVSLRVFSRSFLLTGVDQNVGKQFEKSQLLRRQGYIVAPFDADPTYSLLTSASLSGDLTKTRLATPPIAPGPFLKHQLPAYLKPLPQRMTSVDIDYLFAKGALSVPETAVRNALLRSYCEWVHPYMPLIELHEVLHIIDDGSGEFGKISLLLFQAIMFAGTAFVDMKYLAAAGYTNRKSARKAFFQKARVSAPDYGQRQWLICRSSMTSTTKSIACPSSNPSS